MGKIKDDEHDANLAMKCAFWILTKPKNEDCRTDMGLNPWLGIAPLKRKNGEKACDVCGRNEHDENECNLIEDPTNKNPDVNTSGSSWKDSEKGKSLGRKRA